MCTYTYTQDSCVIMAFKFILYILKDIHDMDTCGHKIRMISQLLVDPFFAAHLKTHGMI